MNPARHTPAPGPPAGESEPTSRLLVWLGPGADDPGAWSWTLARRAVPIAVPERVEACLYREADEGSAVAPEPWEAGIRGFCVRDGHLVGANARRRLRSLVGPEALVVQVVREPVAALRAEVRRARIEALAARWTSPGNARSATSSGLPTAESLYDRLLPRLRVDRRGRAFTPARGRRLVLDREELDDPRSQRLRRIVEDWLGPEALHLPWEGCEPRRDDDLTDALLLISHGVIETQGARLRARLLRADELAARPDVVELARVPSIAARTDFPVEDVSLALVAESRAWGRLPRGIRQVLTNTGLCQHQLEEELLPRWTERTAHLHHELERTPCGIARSLADRLRADLADDLLGLFDLRPTLEGRWGMLAHRALAR